MAPGISQGRVRPGTLLRLGWAHPISPASPCSFPMLAGLDRRLLALLFFLCRDAATCSLVPIFFFFNIWEAFAEVPL